jgi:glycosyltransferase involved in cell wall biosynthesis
MKILVYPHAMEVGGSQLNAIELAGAVRDLGHRVTVVSEHGPLVQRVRAMDLPHVEIPRERRRPSASVARTLRRLVRADGYDIVHGHEWPPGLEAAAAVAGTPAAGVCTVMSMAVAPFIPRSMSLVVGTAALRDHSASGRPGPVHLIEPPVDVVANAPGHPTADFRAEFGLDEGHVTLATVCRLVPELKLEGVLTAIDVVGALAGDLPLRLVVVGDGSARATVEEHAAKANAQAGRPAVVLTGELFDPRPAYAAADVVLGMGGSALRALAFGRPLVVQGEKGFWELLTPESKALFLRQGWYGVGDGRGGFERLSAILRGLVADPAHRERLGAFGRELAVERFSLQHAATVQEAIYREALDQRVSGVRATVDGARSALGLGAYKVRRRYQQVRGTRATDDFNAVRLAQPPRG